MHLKLLNKIRIWIYFYYSCWIILTLQQNTDDNNDKGLYDVAPSTYANKGSNDQEKKASKAAQKKKDKQETL